MEPPVGAPCREVIRSGTPANFHGGPMTYVMRWDSHINMCYTI
jgi:hypothetical protein